MKKDLRKAMKSTRADEEAALDSRFGKVEQLFGEKPAVGTSTPPVKAEPKPALAADSQPTEQPKPAIVAAPAQKQRAKPPQKAPKTASGGLVERIPVSLPAGELEAINAIDKRLMRAGVKANRSEILRAGIAALSELPDKALIQAIKGLERRKPGRQVQ